MQASNSESARRALVSLDRRLLALEPQYRERVWGGQRLRTANPPIGEAWIAYGSSRVGAGPLAGLTLDELSAEHGPAVLGRVVSERFGTRFPLLIKLLDTADWLSVQVHPDDEQAKRLVGPEEFGKTEAWYFLAVETDARILAGVKPGVGPADLAGAIRRGRILEVAESVDVAVGEALLIPAGTLHALGPGVLLYEIQQASDTTYRVYDWDRPGSVGRKLHLDEAIEVTRAVGPTALTHPEVRGDTGGAPAVGCRYFDLEMMCVSPVGGPFEADTLGESFHILTVFEGAVRVDRDGESIELGQFETAIVTGDAGAYSVAAAGGPARLLRSAVPS
jgi:mannose-6-phosphate isomerase